ncbi:MAG: chromate resistance protein ChrB domain-containing protein, partial [Pseudomonadota bacterium]
ACPWLIRRFVDPGAEILFVPARDVLAVAERFDAEPFDVSGAPLSHRGDRCTFDVLCNHFALDTPALRTVADTVRAADLGRPGDVPEAAGLLAISLGLSRLHRDDNAQLDAGMVVYDALYRWARDARAEHHDDSDT